MRELQGSKMINYTPYIVVIGGVAIGVLASIITALEFGRI